MQVIVLAQSRQIKGRVIDRITQQGISGVVISDSTGGIVVVSNDQGEFILYFDDHITGLTFNHISYQSLREKVSNRMEVPLTPVIQELEEIMVFNKPIQKVFVTAFTNMKGSVQKGDLYEAYVREFNVINNNRVNVADAMVDFYINSVGSKALVEIKERRTYESKQEIDLENMEEYFSVMGTGDFRTTLNSFVSVDYLNKMIKNDKVYDYIVKKQVRGNEGTVVILEYDVKDKTSLKEKGFI
ncbi:peptidase associated/transthyretin-like domain-containing protein [Myroides pelagicus]|uniref:Uncharacterized protein n=1 Tax=Myroides pelagicus TaxID=270914 RepID=A0A7K1GQZ2_9FLAO|nr:hypothetical protein [Myroides pelagicus]MEC4112677.1 hypothetical protein [Myroides pelagicus]MTH31090.1 hypothetical protein [Myroides pelagicus]